MRARDASVQRVLAQAVETFCALRAQMTQVAVPDVIRAVIDWAPACALEAAVAHRATYPVRKTEYRPVLASVLEAGHAVSALDYQAFSLRRMELRGRFAHLFRSIDLLLTPVQPFAPLTLAEVRTLGAQPQLILKLQRYTAPFDLTGHPTVTLPGGFSDAGMSLGFQLAAATRATSSAFQTPPPVLHRSKSAAFRGFERTQLSRIAQASF